MPPSSDARTCPFCGRAKGTRYETCPDPACRQELAALVDRLQLPTSPIYVYMLRLERPHRLYVGMTADLRRRVDEHRRGRTRTTAGRSPRLVWFMPCGSRALATAAEITVRRLSEDEKEHLITQQRAITRELDYS